MSTDPANMDKGLAIAFAVIVTLYLIVAAAQMAHCETLPDAPQPQPKKVTFWTFQPTRTNRQTLTSPWFWAPHAAAFGMAIWNVKRSRRAGASYGDALVGPAVMLPLDYALDRWVWRPFSVATASAGAILRARGAITRTYE